MPKFTNRPL